MATFPGGRVLPVQVNAPGSALSPRPILPPGTSTDNRGAIPVTDSTQCVEFQGFTVILRSGVE